MSQVSKLVNDAKNRYFFMKHLALRFVEMEELILQASFVSIGFDAWLFSVSYSMVKKNVEEWAEKEQSVEWVIWQRTVPECKVKKENLIFILIKSFYTL